MDFTGRKKLSRSRVEKRGGGAGAAANNLLAGQVQPPFHPRDGRALFSAQLRGLWLHDIFYEGAEGTGVQRGAIWNSFCGSLRRDGGRDDSQLLAFGQDA